jgi:hypothetical protein
VYLNQGDARFSDQRRTPFGPPDAAIRVAEAADLDGDGRLDLVASDERRGVAIYFGAPDGRFSPGTSIVERAGEDSPVPYALAVADLDLDGNVDVVVGHVEAPSVVYFNDGGGRQFTPLPFGDDQGSAYGFAIADLDGDGLPDIAAARSGAPNVAYLATRTARASP